MSLFVAPLSLAYMKLVQHATQHLSLAICKLVCNLVNEMNPLRVFGSVTLLGCQIVSYRGPIALFVARTIPWTAGIA